MGVKLALACPTRTVRCTGVWHRNPGTHLKQSDMPELPILRGYDLLRRPSVGQTS